MLRNGLYAVICLLPGAALCGPFAAIDEALSKVDRELVYESGSGATYFELSGQLDLQVYRESGEGGPSGFFFPDADKTWTPSPRLTLQGDAYFGEKLYAHLKFRWDDGVHPGVGKVYNNYTQTRVDEAFVRYEVVPRHLSVQAGIFTPFIGGFLERQDPTVMGLISYPLVYENVTSVSDVGVVSGTPDFVDRRNRPDNKVNWLPLLWAPLYTQGVSAFGSFERFDYAVNLTHSALSSRGIIWNDSYYGDPTLSARLRHRPAAGMQWGVTLSHGPYFRHFLESDLPAGTGLSDYDQTLVGFEFSWARGAWESWTEVFWNRFEVPNVGDDADTFSYYVELRRKLSPRTWVSARWNQEIHFDIEGPAGPTDWDNDVYRIDLGFGFMPGRHQQWKVQYSHQHQDASFQNGEHLVVGQWTLFF